VHGKIVGHSGKWLGFVPALAVVVGLACNPFDLPEASPPDLAERNVLGEELHWVAVSLELLLLK
jgi:hypothetical protein